MKFSLVYLVNVSSILSFLYSLSPIISNLFNNSLTLEISNNSPASPFNRIWLGPVGQLDEITFFPHYKASTKTKPNPSTFDDKIKACAFFIK